MTLLSVDELEVTYAPRRSLFGGRPPTRAVRGVSLDIAAGETLGLVGESGSGKSTIGRAVLKLVRPAAGGIIYDGIDVDNAAGRDRTRLHREVQAVFQDPYSSLDPSMTVGDIVGEPLQVHLGLRGRERTKAVADLLQHVGLPADCVRLYPHEFSGGQRQRISIARAVASRPRLVICDEPVSALDVSTQSQMINLFQRLGVEYQLAYLFIAHDLAVVRHISDRIAVLYAGRLMEIGPANRVYFEPAHPYTTALLAAIPLPDPVRQRERRASRAVLGARATSDAHVAEVGCPFAVRCPHVMDVCRVEMPPMVAVEGGGASACHLHVPSAATQVEVQT